MALKIKKLLLWILPSFVFLIPAAVGFGLEAFNRYYRGLASPLLWISIGFLMLGSLFLVRKRLLLWLMVLLTLFYLSAFLVLGLWKLKPYPSVVHYYRTWWLHTPTGRLHLEQPLGYYPPASGAYVSCHFPFAGWKDLVRFQPTLCTGFDERLRLTMFLNDHETETGWLREFQTNNFLIQRKTLLGDPIDRGALRIAFVGEGKPLRPVFQIREMYEVFEKETEDGQSRILESISRDGRGRLKTLTESSLPNLTDRDLFAVYNSQGLLTKIPRISGKNVVFPGKIDVTPILEYRLPERIDAGGPRDEN